MALFNQNREKICSLIQETSIMFAIGKLPRKLCKVRNLKEVH